eukprot:SAG31_NODE_876_length_11307_cov_3.506781_9_plen_203_part_00
MLPQLAMGLCWRLGLLLVPLMPAAASAAAAAAAARVPAAAVVAQLQLPHFALRVHADCTATVTSTRTNSSSAPEPLLQLYNRVADNRPSNLDPCSRADAQTGRGGKVGLTVTAPHGAGTLDIALSASADRRWVTFELTDLSRWRGDPLQRHAIWPTLLPADMNGTAPFVAGAFEGFRGSEGSLQVYACLIYSDDPLPFSMRI